MCGRNFTKANLTCSSAAAAEFFPNPSRVAPHIQDRSDADYIARHIIINGERKSAGQKSMKPKMDRVNACMQAQRFEVGEEGVEEVASYTSFAPFVKITARSQILRSLRQNDDRADAHQRSWSRS